MVVHQDVVHINDNNTYEYISFPLDNKVSKHVEHGSVCQKHLRRHLVARPKKEKHKN